MCVSFRNDHIIGYAKRLLHTRKSKKMSVYRSLKTRSRCPFLDPARWGTADTEIKVPPFGIPDLSQIPLFY